MPVATPRTLCQLEPGHSSVVEAFTGPPEVGHRLMEIGILVGCEISAIRRAPFGYPVEVDVCGARFCLGKETAEAIILAPNE